MVISKRKMTKTGIIYDLDDTLFPTSTMPKSVFDSFFQAFISANQDMGFPLFSGSPAGLVLMVRNTN